MSVDQYQRTVNGLDKEIADLEKKKAAKDKDIASLQSKIVSTQKSINKNTSQGSLNSKRRQIMPMIFLKVQRSILKTAGSLMTREIDL